MMAAIAATFLSNTAIHIAPGAAGSHSAVDTIPLVFGGIGAT
jgi:hypothetical protein